VSSEPNFSAYPFDRLPRVSRREANVQSLVARWLSAWGSSLPRLQALVGPAQVTLARTRLDDPNAARCTIRVGGIALEARASSAGIKRLAKQLLGGPDELGAPRPLTFAEIAIWCSIVETALEDLGVAAQVWPATRVTASSSIDLDVTLAGVPLAVALDVPADLELRVPPSAPAAWTERMKLDATIVVGRCALDREDLARLRVRSLITLDRVLELEVLGGSLGLRAEPRAVVAEVVTGYVRRPMSLPDNAHVELTVALGTTQLSLRQVAELSIGQIISLGRPLAGPFELRAAGRLVGKGELVDVDGELAVRIVSVGDQE
jgi:flagellar motor switch/type III secretory pathway protein FliN